MDEFKPEDELKPDPSDRRTGRSRQSSERVDEPQINFDDVELDADERRPSRTRKTRDDREEYAEEDYEAEENSLDEERAERRPRKRKKAAAAKPVRRLAPRRRNGQLLSLPYFSQRRGGPGRTREERRQGVRRRTEGTISARRSPRRRVAV